MSMQTALDREMTGGGYLRLQGVLMALSKRRGLTGANAEDVVAETFRVAFTHERSGQQWDPAVVAAPLHLARILENVIRERRRKAKRKPTSQLEEGQDFASDAPGIDEAVGDADEIERRALAVYEHLARETSSGLSLRVFDARREGVSSHKALADSLRCTIEDIKAAMRRIERRTKHFRNGGGGGQAS